MTGRRVTTAVTMTVLFVVLVAMAVLGFSKLTAPLPETGSASGSDCTGAEKEVQTFLKRKEVQVSVFNAGSKKGQASRALEKIEEAGFRAGNAGNAPGSADVRRALVWTTEENDPAAQLVAKALGKRTQVEVTRTDLGPGVDVLVGNRFQGLDPDAPKRVKLDQPVQTCVQVD